MIYLPDPIYNPNFFNDINSSTKLGPGISIIKFLGAKGSRLQFERIKFDKFQIARNLYLHAELIKKTTVNSDFDDYRLVVAEGIYVPAEKETVTAQSVNDLKQSGRAVVYQLYGTNGKIDFSKSFDLAVYWKDYCDYEKIILDYDTYDPSGEPSCQIVAVMPNVPESFDISFQRKVETTFNTKLQSSNELVEILL